VIVGIWNYNCKVSAMSEYQKVVLGVLSLSHPEIFKLRNSAAAATAKATGRRRDPKPSPAAKAVRAVKFAFAALVAGSRAIPLGDNGRITHELGEYGTHLKG
jgi:hypothetical protein